MMIAGSVNMTFGVGEINAPTVGKEEGPRAERAGVCSPLAVGGQGVISGRPHTISVLALPYLFFSFLLEQSQTIF